MESKFEIIVVGQSQDPDTTIQGLKQLLKRLGRTFNLRCETIKPVANNINATGSTETNGDNNAGITR